MKKLLFSLLSIVSTLSLTAQNSTEFGAGIGFSSYLGDLQSPDYTYKGAKICSGVFARQNLSPYFAARAFMNVGRISGDDASTDDQSLINRNLSFRSNIFELGAVAEISVLPFDPYNSHGTSAKRHFSFVPYFFGGINYFHFNPKTEYNGTWVELQPLNTEGQKTSLVNGGGYNLSQIAIPFGIGVKYQPSKKIVLSFELGFRKTFTDYLDDVSTQYTDLNKLALEEGSLSAALSYRGDELVNYNGYVPADKEIRGNPSNKDWYTINTFSFAYKLYQKKSRYTPMR